MLIKGNNGNGDCCCEDLKDGINGLKDILISIDSAVNKIKDTATSILKQAELANWNLTIGNYIIYNYFNLPDPINNPSGNTNNLKSAQYYNPSGLFLTQSFTYDLNDNITSITVL